MLQHFFLVLFLLLQPVLCLGLGLWLIDGVRRVAPKLSAPGAIAFVLGLLVNLWVILGLKSIGAPWAVAAFVPFTPLVLFPNYFWRAIDAIKIKPGWDALLWIVVTSVIGLSLLNGNSGYQTAWPNAYGDYGLHLGMIASFVWGDNFPPHYHIFAGAKLSYPFFINLWSASVWWISPEPTTLALIFFVHWMVVWLVVYSALVKANRALPWLLLFGGGTLLTLGEDDGAGITSKSYFWSAFLHTIWAPQRSATLGLMLLAAVIPYFHDNESTNDRERCWVNGPFVLIGAILGLGFLAHGHFCTVVSLYIGLCLLIRGVAFGWRTWFEVKGSLSLAYVAGVLAAAALPLLLIPELGLTALGRILLACGIGALFVSLVWGCAKSLATESSQEFVVDILSFVIPLSLAGLSYPLLSAKVSTFSLMSGWFDVAGGGGLFRQLVAWLQSGFVWITILFTSWILTRRHVNFTVILLLMVVFNLVQLSIWRWDQIKVFIALYAIVLSQLPKLDRPTSKVFYGLAFTLLAVPGVFQLWCSYSTGTMTGLYSKEDLARAQQIRELSSPSDVFLDDGRHLSLATIAGRTVYIGYDGWLWTHGLKYQERVSQLQQGLCDNCPKYVIWDPETAKKWPNLKDRITPTEVLGVYKFGPKKF